MKDSAFYSKDGYLINQPLMRDVPFGKSTSDRSGCGWIAAYNLLLFRGREPQPEQIRDYLIKRSLFRGKIGTNPHALRACLRHCGLKTKLALTTRFAQSNAEKSDAGVILYAHKSGMHYVAFLKEPVASGNEKTRFRFLNAKAGDERHVDDMRSFIQKESILPLVYVLTLKKSEQ